MKIFDVKVIPKAKKCGVEHVSENVLKVKVSSAPDKGKANDEVVELLADHFNVAKSSIVILSGKTNRQKKIQINTPKNTV